MTAECTECYCNQIMKHILYIHPSLSNTELVPDTPTTMAPTTRSQRTTGSEASEATLLPQSTIIAIIAASAGGLFLVAAFILIITLLLCCFLYKKSKLLSASNLHPETNGNQHNPQPVNNVAYNYNGGIQLTNNLSYNEGNNSRMVNNQAYNIRGNDEPYYSAVHDMK